MNSQDILKLKAELKSLMNRKKFLLDQYAFATESNESSSKEIESIQDSIKSVDADIRFVKQELSYLLDNSIVHDIDDIRKIYFGLFGNSVESASRWSDFYNYFRNDESLMDTVTSSYTRIKKDEIRKYLERYFG